MARLRGPFGIACAALAACATGSPRTGNAAFAVDPTWPKPLPNNWILGQVSGIAVDANDHVWLIQRPGSLTEDEKGAALDPPLSKCCVPAPPVMELDADGNLLQAWGGPGRGYDWPSNEHGIYVDAKGHVWVSGNGDNDGQIVRFTRDGKFISQIGKPGPQTGNNDVTSTASVSRGMGSFTCATGSTIGSRSFAGTAPS